MIKKVRKHNGGYVYKNGAETFTGYPQRFYKTYNPYRTDNLKFLKKKDIFYLYNHWTIGCCFAFSPEFQTKKEGLRITTQQLKRISFIKRLKP